MTRQNAALDEDYTNRPIISTAAAARLLDLSTVHVRRLARAGKLPRPIRIGDRKLGWRTADLKAVIEGSQFTKK
jgi:predicted DNA-binding transcriptional regulator AlpA